jgi:hypothetical protein
MRVRGLESPRPLAKSHDSLSRDLAIYEISQTLLIYPTSRNFLFLFAKIASIEIGMIPALQVIEQLTNHPKLKFKEA